jgi:hypothetical protein
MLRGHASVVGENKTMANTEDKQWPQNKLALLWRSD